MKNGVIILDKEEGMTSQTAVNRVKRLFGVSKAGHTGTLDPLATGVLPVLIGRAVKASEFLTTKDKHYTATLLLGIETDTEDITGEVIGRCDDIPSEEEVYAAVLSFLATSMQTPPMYSAIKVGGKKLCDLAREGKNVEREPREITVFEIKPQRLSEREYLIDVHCSKGTYIRTLCADIGARLGCYGCMKTLRRSSVSCFTLADAHKLSEIEKMSEEERGALVIPTEKVFSSFRKIELVPFFARLARCGQPIYAKKARFHIEVGERVTLYDEKGFFALAQGEDIDGEICAKPIRQFDTEGEG